MDLEAEIVGFRSLCGAEEQTAPNSHVPSAPESAADMRFATSRLLRLAPLAALAAVLASCAAPAPRQPAVKPTETFDAAWEMVRDEHFDPSLNGVDWNAVRAELRPRAAKARSADELRGVLNDMLARLGQSHFAIIPAGDEPPVPPAIADAGATSAAPAKDDSGLDGIGARTEPTTSASNGPGIAGLDIALVEGEPTVLRVSPGLAASRAGVLAGWRLVSIDGIDVNALLQPIRKALAAERNLQSPQARKLRATLALTAGELLVGNAGDVRRVVFADASGGEQKVSLAFEPAPLGVTQFGNLPPFPIEVESRRIELPVQDGAAGGKPITIGVISFNIWMTGASDAIDRAVDSLRGCDGIVLDLRGNPGGIGAMSMGVAGHFLKESASLGSMIGRESTLVFNAEPRKVSHDGKRVRPYATKPLAILIDGRTASTSEVFAAGLQDLGRARVFGETSAGMALPARASELPNGEVLLHAVADFVTSKGTRIEGRGVVPDEPVLPKRAELLKGDDTALSAATKWISGRTIEARTARANSPTSSSGMPAQGLIPTAMPTAMPTPMPSALPPGNPTP